MTRCSTCEHCTTNRTTGAPLCAIYTDHEYQSGRVFDVKNNALPKTSPFWCPRRPCNQTHRLIVAKEDK